MGDRNTKDESWYCGYNGVTYDSKSEGVRALKNIRDSLYSNIAELQEKMDNLKNDWNAVDTFEQILVNYYSLYSEQRESTKDMARLGESILSMLNDNPNLYVEGPMVSTNVEDITSFVSTMYSFHDNVTSKMNEFNECGNNCDAAKRMIANEVEVKNNAINQLKNKISEINYYI